MWDYLNRMLSSGLNNSTTTYAYDPAGNRVLQTSTTSATYYPNKYYSFTSTKSGANTYATSTNYVFNGDTLLATIDQALYNGAATGSPITRYIHPDHLGSTNAVTDQSGNFVQLMDYYPYGATRIATSTYPTNEKRQYIGQFSDAQTNLNYLQARYYDSTRGQFTSEDPVFWISKQRLNNPQTLNAYSYAINNPIAKKDPSGLQYYDASGSFTFPVYGIPIGPIGGVQVDPKSDDPFIYFGATVTDKPGPGGAMMYSPSGSPSEGLSISFGGTSPSSPSAGGQIAISPNSSGLNPSGAYGYSTPGSGISITYAMSLSKFLYTMGGPLTYTSTPMLTNNSFNPISQGVNPYASCYAGLLSSSIQTRISTANSANSITNSSSSGGSGSSGVSSWGGGTTQPSSNSLWVTPSGAVVTWSGSLVVGPVSSK